VGGKRLQKEETTPSTWRRTARQPANRFKPYTCATASGQGISPSATLQTNPQIFTVRTRRTSTSPSTTTETSTTGAPARAAAHPLGQLLLRRLRTGRTPTARCGQGCGGAPPQGRALAPRRLRDGSPDGYRDKVSTTRGWSWRVDPGVTPLEMASPTRRYPTAASEVGWELDATARPRTTPPSTSAPVAFDKVTDHETARRSRRTDQDLPGAVPACSPRHEEHPPPQILEGTGPAGSVRRTTPNGQDRKNRNDENNGGTGSRRDEHFTTCVWVGPAETKTPMKTRYNGGPATAVTYPP